MAIVNVTAMTELTAPADADVFYVVDDPGSAALPRKITYANIMKQAYGEVSVVGASATQSLSATTWTKITAFTVDGQAKNTTVSHSNDKVTAANAGVYLATISASFTTGAAANVTLAVYWNGSITVARGERTTASSSDIANISASALVNATSDADDFELYGYLSTGTTITIKDAALSVVRVG